MSDTQSSRAVANTQFRGMNTGVQIGQVFGNDAKSYAQSVAEWMSPLDFNQKQADIFERREGHTGQWFLEDQTFKEWEAGEIGPLWCHGIPGCGKTVLLSIMVDHLRRKYSEQKRVGIACVYCQYKEQEEQNPRNLFANIWRQLYDVDADVPDEVQELFARRKKNNTRATTAEIVAILKTQMSRHSDVYLLIDAIDELPKTGGAPLTILRGLEDTLLAMESIGTVVRLLVTSRNATSSLPIFTELAIQTRAIDIAHVVSARIKRGISNDYYICERVKKDSGLSGTITNTITEKSDKTFLMAKLYLESLATETSESDIRNVLDTLPQNLDSAYEKVWSRIGSQNEDLWTLAAQVLRWLVFTYRQLDVDELLHALAVRPEQTKFGKGRTTVGRLLSACQGLVVVDKRSNVVRLVHYSTQQYFDRNRDRLFPGAHNDLTMACLTYLRLHPFKKGPCEFRGSNPWILRDQKGAINESKLLTSRLKSYPFLKYAASHWGDHARKASPRVTEDAIWAFLQDTKAFESSIQAQNGENAEDRDPPSMVEVLVSFRLKSVLSKVMYVRPQLLLDLSEKAMSELLSMAARRKQHKIINLLLRAGAKLSLSQAISSGHDLLYAHFEKANASLSIDEPTLEEAVLHDRLPTITRYIDTGENANATLEKATSVFFISIGHGKLESVRLAVKRGASVHAADEHGDSALILAAAKGRLDVVEFLVSEGADATAVGVFGSTATFVAVENGHPGLVKFLFQFNPSLTHRDGTGMDLLGTAVASQAIYERRLRWLCEYWEKSDASSGLEEQGRPTFELGIEGRLASVLVNIQNPRSITSHKPFMNDFHEDQGQIDIIHMILDKGADTTTATPLDRNQETYLHLAIGNPRRLELLWTAGSNVLGIDARDWNGRTPLHYALAAGSVPGATWCISHGADVNARDQYGATPLHLSVLSDPCLSLILHFGVNINATDFAGRTPLHYAQLLFPISMDTLKRAGADEFIRDNDGLTADDYNETSPRNDPDIEELIVWFGTMKFRYRGQPSVIERELDRAQVFKRRCSPEWAAEMRRIYDSQKEYWIAPDDEDNDREI